MFYLNDDKVVSHSLFHIQTRLVVHLDIIYVFCGHFLSTFSCSYSISQANFGDMIEYLPVPEQDGLETSILGLVFQTEPHHFRKGVLEIKCTATIGNGYWITNVTVTEQSIDAVNAQPSIPGHNRMLSAGK
jgi:hypothetical protein